MSFRSSPAYATALAAESMAIAVVIGGSSGIGLAIAKRIASFPFISQVLCVSRSITAQHLPPPQFPSFPHNDKLMALAADITTPQGRATVVRQVRELCCCGDRENDNRTKQLRFLIQSAGTIDPIKPVLELEPEDLRRALLVNCEAPFFLTTALHPYLKPLTGNDKAVAGRVLHVSSGAAHGAPPVGWACYGISKAAFFQSFKVLEREFRQLGGGDVDVVVGSFKPGVVETNVQAVIRSADPSVMPGVKMFQDMKAKADELRKQQEQQEVSQQQQQPPQVLPLVARPPPQGALDSPDNAAFFAEYLLLGTTDEEFANAQDENEHDIRNAKLFERWVDPSQLPK